MDCWINANGTRYSNLKNQIKLMGEIVVLGGGESGTGAALLAKAKGLKVFVSDLGQIKEE